MTVAEYIRGQFRDFGVSLSDASVTEALLRGGLDGGQEVEAGNFPRVHLAVVRSVPKLLLAPQGVTQGPVSVTRAQRDAIIDWYRMQCRELGIKDELTVRPKVTIY